MNHNFFKDYFYKSERRISKWEHYFDIYEEYFSPYREDDVNFLEIGVANGGSMAMWNAYFSRGSHFFGVDVLASCKQFENHQTKIFIGSQEDDRFLHALGKELPPLDIVLDDGGHTMKQQKKSFEALFPLVKPGGIYMIEDTHTSYEYTYGGGLRRRQSFMEFCKRLVDNLYGYQIPNRLKGKRNEKYTKWIDSVHFHNGVVVFKKNLQTPQKIIVSKPLTSEEKGRMMGMSFKKRLKKLYSFVSYKLGF